MDHSETGNGIGTGTAIPGRSPWANGLTPPIGSCFGDMHREPQDQVESWGVHAWVPGSTSGSVDKARCMGPHLDRVQGISHPNDTTWEGHMNPIIQGGDCPQQLLCSEGGGAPCPIPYQTNHWSRRLNGKEQAPCACLVRAPRVDAQVGQRAG